MPVQKNALLLLLMRKRSFARAKTKLQKLPSRHSSRAEKCASPQKILLTVFLKTPRMFLQLLLMKLKAQELPSVSSRKPHRPLHRNKFFKKDKKTRMSGSFFIFFYTHRSPQKAKKQRKNEEIFHGKAKFLIFLKIITIFLHFARKKCVFSHEYAKK